MGTQRQLDPGRTGLEKNWQPLPGSAQLAKLTFPKVLHLAPTSRPWLGWPPIGLWQPCDKGESEPPSLEYCPSCGRCGRVLLSAALSRVCRARCRGAEAPASPGPVPLAGRSVPKSGARTPCPFAESYVVVSYDPTSSLIQGCVCLKLDCGTSGL